LKVDDDFGIPGEKGLKGEIFDRETESGKRNLERFPLYNYLRDKRWEKSNTYPIMDEIFP